MGSWILDHKSLNELEDFPIESRVNSKRAAISIGGVYRFGTSESEEEGSF